MGFHRIADWRVGGESTHKSASFLYTSFVSRINIQILNYPESFHFIAEGQAIHGWPGSAVGPEQLQCVHGVLTSKYRTDLERLPTTIDLQIGNNTTRITLTKAVALIYETGPTAV